MLENSGRLAFDWSSETHVCNWNLMWSATNYFKIKTWEKYRLSRDLPDLHEHFLKHCLILKGSSRCFWSENKHFCPFDEQCIRMLSPLDPAESSFVLIFFSFLLPKYYVQIIVRRFSHLNNRFDKEFLVSQSYSSNSKYCYRLTYSETLSLFWALCRQMFINSCLYCGIHVFKRAARRTLIYEYGSFRKTVRSKSVKFELAFGSGIFMIFIAFSTSKRLLSLVVATRCHGSTSIMYSSCSEIYDQMHLPWSVQTIN